jgi:hypothetical protein
MMHWNPVWGLLGSLLACMAIEPGAHAAEWPPNVILIFSDDQGTIDLNIY